MRSRVEWHRLNSPFTVDSGGLGADSTTFYDLKGMRYSLREPKAETSYLHMPVNVFQGQIRGHSPRNVSVWLFSGA